MPTVCCVGDSVTVGAAATSGLGWRDKLLASQPTITYVGTQGVSPHQHESYSGHDALELRTVALPNVITLEPEIVVLTVGTVAVPLEEADEVVAAHQALALAGEIAWYGARVFLCSIPPKTSTSAQPVITYNGLLLAGLATLPNVSWVDLSVDVVQTEDFADAIHPDESGYVKMHATLDAAWPPAEYVLGQGAGYTGAQRVGRGAWTL